MALLIYVGYCFGFRDRYIIDKDKLKTEFVRGMTHLKDALEKKGIIIDLKKQKED